MISVSATDRAIQREYRRISAMGAAGLVPSAWMAPHQVRISISPDHLVAARVQHGRLLEVRAQSVAGREEASAHLDQVLRWGWIRRGAAVLLVYSSEQLLFEPEQKRQADLDRRLQRGVGERLSLKAAKEMTPLTFCRAYGRDLSSWIVGVDTAPTESFERQLPEGVRVERFPQILCAVEFALEQLAQAATRHGGGKSKAAILVAGATRHFTLVVEQRGPGQWQWLYSRFPQQPIASQVRELPDVIRQANVARSDVEIVVMSTVPGSTALEPAVADLAKHPEMAGVAINLWLPDRDLVQMQPGLEECAGLATVPVGLFRGLSAPLLPEPFTQPHMTSEEASRVTLTGREVAAIRWATRAQVLIIAATFLVAGLSWGQVLKWRWSKEWATREQTVAAEEEQVFGMIQDEDRLLHNIKTLDSRIGFGPLIACLSDGFPERGGFRIRGLNCQSRRATPQGHRGLMIEITGDAPADGEQVLQEFVASRTNVTRYLGDGYVASSQLVRLDPAPGGQAGLVFQAQVSIQGRDPLPQYGAKLR